MPLKEKPAGRLISFEGPEGSGKSTQISLLAKRLQQHDKEVITTREPGGTEIGEQIRNIIVHNSKGDEMCPETELLLFTAARAQVVCEVIVPALIDGKFVLSDRYLDSTTVYQGVARNLSSGPVADINRFAVGNVMPDITVIVDVPPGVSISRLKQRVTDLPDRMERENIDFYHKVREGYLLLAKQMTERVILVDGTKSIEEVAEAVWEHVQVRLGLA